MLQQCLPLAVLKRFFFFNVLIHRLVVATVLTACGIETGWSKTEEGKDKPEWLQQCLPLAVLKHD